MTSTTIMALLNLHGLCLHQVIEKSQEQGHTLYFTFIDCMREFDMINHEALWIVLTKMGCPPSIISVVRALYTDIKVRISVYDKLTVPVAYSSRVKQGCVLAPTLLTIYIAAIYEHTFLGCSDGVWFCF